MHFPPLGVACLGGAGNREGKGQEQAGSTRLIAGPLSRWWTLLCATLVPDFAKSSLRNFFFLFLFKKRSEKALEASCFSPTLPVGRPLLARMSHL